MLVIFYSRQKRCTHIWSEKLFWLLPNKPRCYQLKTKNGWMVHYGQSKREKKMFRHTTWPLLYAFLLQVILAKKTLSRCFQLISFYHFWSTVVVLVGSAAKVVIVLWWFSDWFMLCKTLIWSLWPIVSKGSIKMRPPFLHPVALALENEKW